MIRAIELYVAWLLASFGTLLSLYFSEVVNWEPCHLCWYERICLFPLIVILGIAAYKSFFDITRYVLPQTIIGFLFALYQIGLQEIPGWSMIDICGAGPSCAEKHYIGLGPITIPMLAAFGFFVIGLLLILSWKRYKKSQN